jgi:CRISPR/Cas system CSM-associated protein Csm3 (group 7 of RAMP superfamily)
VPPLSFAIYVNREDTNVEHVYLFPAERYAEPRTRRVGYRIWRKRSDFRVTDGSLALNEGNILYETLTLKSFSYPPAGSPPEPSIDRNPYNSVALPKGGPWLEEPNSDSGKHHGHQCWHPDLLHGHIDLIITARSPVFVPTWTPQESKEMPKPKQLDFYKLHRWEGEARIPQYAIAGASLKGALRSMVEALANDRFGILDNPKHRNLPIYERMIPYRRRVYRVGNASLVNRQWQVEEINFNEDARLGVSDYPSDLLGQLARHRRKRRVTSITTPKIFVIPDCVVSRYRSNLDHPHYQTHLDNWKKQWSKQVRDGTFDRTKCKPNYDPSLNSKNTVDELLDLRMPSSSPASPIRIFFTIDPATNLIDSFGRNVNYLWPSLWTIQDLAGDWFPPLPGDNKMGLGKRLGLAERMFGFVSDHDKNGSSPFRGKLKFEPLRAQPEVTPVPIELAPLTSPQSRAKSRPLYLSGRSDGLSASYSDKEKPELRGRKFYWKQRFNNGEIWDFHKRNAAHAADQCPPTLNVLPAGTKFTTRIHFENLSQPELGVLLYALLGPEPVAKADREFQSGDHCIHLGKAKPRGLGVCSVEAKLIWFRPAEEYASLKTRPPRCVATEDDIKLARRAFANWCEQRAQACGDTKAFESLHHIADFLKLHTYPTDNSVRYYPVNWSQYTWLPKPNRNPDEPLYGQRPDAMKPAREVKP